MARQEIDHLLLVETGSKGVGERLCSSSSRVKTRPSASVLCDRTFQAPFLFAQARKPPAVIPSAAERSRAIPWRYLQVS
jgi:hypothetical protein